MKFTDDEDDFLVPVALSDDKKSFPGVPEDKSEENV